MFRMLSGEQICALCIGLISSIRIKTETGVRRQFIKAHKVKAGLLLKGAVSDFQIADSPFNHISAA